MQEARQREERKQKMLNAPTDDAPETTTNNNDEISSEETDADKRTISKIKRIRKMLIAYQAVMRRIEKKNGVPEEGIYERNQISATGFEEEDEYREARYNVRRLLKKSIELSMAAEPDKYLLEFPEIFKLT
eukprot:GHVL01034607.1.p1 GENE.GHVL01034607.1~~GHVL01034607.1.p1  ORF type:complete len:131 (-),score=28.71 GHVL01034607.1:157-549(-)